MSRGEVLQELAEWRASLDATIEAVGNGSRTLAEVFAAASHESAIGFLYAVKALEVAPQVGKVRARRILEDLGLGETTRIGELGSDQIAAILAEMAR